MELKKAEASIRIGDKGLFAHGKIYPNVTQLDEEKLKKEEKEEEEREARKRYLTKLSESESKPIKYSILKPIPINTWKMTFKIMH